MKHKAILLSVMLGITLTLVCIHTSKTYNEQVEMINAYAKYYRDTEALLDTVCTQYPNISNTIISSHKCVAGMNYVCSKNYLDSIIYQK